jgi:hypothetical protein
MPPTVVLRTSVNEAISEKNPNREAAIQAIHKEVEQLMNLNVGNIISWSEIKKSPNYEIIGSFLFLKEKYKADGSFDKMKARLAAMGNEEEASLFTQDPSSPTANISSIMVLLSIAAQYGCKIETDDVPGAYLHALLPERRFIVIRLPKFVDKIWCDLSGLNYEKVKDQKNNVYVKLKKALYGLKESGLLWYDMFIRSLKKFGYLPTASDPCVLVKWARCGFHFIAIYVDDILHVSNNTNMIKLLRNYLEAKFGSLGTQSGPKLSFLSINLEILGENSIKMDQNAYIGVAIAKWAKIYVIKASKYPSNHDLFISNEDDEAETEETKKIQNSQNPSDDIEESDQQKQLEYMKMIKNDYFISTNDKIKLNEIIRSHFSSTIYLSILMSLSYAAARCRPDILKETAYLSTQVHKITILTWKKLFKICGYLLDNPTLDIVFSDASPNAPLQAYSDASFLVHNKTNGHTGVILKLFGNTVVQKSVKQRTVTKSVMESEIMALETTMGYVLYICNLMKDLGMDLNVPAVIFSDNAAAIAVANKGRGSFSRTKHFLNKYYWIKQFIDNKTVEIIHIPTKENIADFFTKSIIGATFWYLLRLVVRNHQDK